MELDLPVHAKHFKDGFPLCWPMEQEGLFEGTWDDTQVNCPDCLKILEEE
jgi:hypothetical protein